MRRKALERETQLSSLQLTADDNSLVGACDVGYSCAYSSTLSWLTPTLPLMAENNPRVVFERLFGSSRQHGSAGARVAAASGPEHSRFGHRAREAAAAETRSSRQHEGERLPRVASRRRNVGSRKPRSRATSGVPEVEQPPGIPDGFEPHVKLLYDLQLLAYQSDLTRVITFMYGREQTGRPYPQIGIPEPHHPLTHHQNDPAKMEKCTAIQLYHVTLFASYLEKLRTTPDGDGSLLDHVMLLFGGGISNSDRHTHGPLPTLLVGGGAGALKGGRHLVYPERHAADQPAADASQQAGRARRKARRQHGTVQGVV